jgi:uncharacterized protein (DUF58 family)
MIAPQSRLLWWTALVMAPAAGLGFMFEALWLPGMGLAAGVFGLGAVDAWLARGAAGRIKVELPPITRLTKDRPGTLELRIRNLLMEPRRVRIGLAFPEGITTPHETMWVHLPEKEEWSSVSWPCEPVKRGCLHLRQVFIEERSRFGFWAVRAALEVNGEIRAYPNLFEERKSLAAMFLNRGLPGVHVQRQSGKGREFEKLREYISGDSYEDIHWKATAKRGHPVTKIYQLERTQEIYVVIDASRLSGRPVTGTKEKSHEETETVLERFLTASLVLGLAAEQQGDLFGLITFSDRVDHFLRARNGKAHFNACREAIYGLECRRATQDFEELFTFIRLRLRRRALVLVLTSLDDPVLAGHFVRGIDLVRGQHLVLANMIAPEGAVPLFSDPDIQSPDELYEKLGGHIRWHELRELGKVLERRGVRFSLLQDERLSGSLVAQYLEVKGRQLL